MGCGCKSCGGGHHESSVSTLQQNGISVKRSIGNGKSFNSSRLMTRDAALMRLLKLSTIKIRY
jgi:hypothetical protein